MPISIDRLSCVALHIETFFDDTLIGGGTGFTVCKGTKRYLITNWHVVSGRDPITRDPISKSAAVPNRLVVWLHKKGFLGQWNGASMPLVSEHGKPLWNEGLHHKSGHMVDVVALPLPATGDEVDFFDMELELKDVDVVVTPSESVSIVGFPFGRSSDGKLAIWKTGHVASDIDIDFGTKPVFLVDATTKSGMSGSPVVARRVGVVTSSSGVNIGLSATRLLGVYSGRISDQPDDKDNWNLGMVWKATVIDGLLV